MNENTSLTFKTGLSHGIPIFLGYLSVSMAFGIIAVSSGLSVGECVIISATNVTSAGQLSAVTLMANGASLFEMGLTQFIINLRYALMSLSLSQKIGTSIKFLDRFIISFMVTDEVFAVSASQKGAVPKKYMYGLILMPFIGWVSGTFIGAAASSILPMSVRSALGIALYSMFIAIVIPPSKKAAPIRNVVIGAALLRCIFFYTPYLRDISSGFSIIICTVIAAGVAAVTCPIEEGA